MLTGTPSTALQEPALGSALSLQLPQATVLGAAASTPSPAATMVPPPAPSMAPPATTFLQQTPIASFGAPAAAAPYPASPPPTSASLTTAAVPTVPTTAVVPLPPVAAAALAGPPMVAMPASVLAHIDAFVSEMERDLSELQTVELQQQARRLREMHLSQLRRGITQDQVEAEQLQAEDRTTNRLATLEADHFALKQQVEEVEQQRTAAEQQCDELLRDSASVREVLEVEKARAIAAEEGLRLAEERLVQEQVSFTEAIQRSERDRLTLQAELEAVLTDCKALQGRVEQLELEDEAECDDGGEGTAEQLAALALEAEIRQREQGWMSRHSELELERDRHKRTAEEHAMQSSEVRAAMEALQKELGQHRDRHLTYEGRVKELEAQLLDFRGSRESHAEQLTAHQRRAAELEVLHASAQAEVRAWEEKHSRHSAGHRQQLSELEQQLSELRDADGSRSRQSAVHLNKIKQLEEELMNIRLEKENHARQNTAHRAKLTDLEQLVEEYRLKDDNHSRTHASNRVRLQELEQRLVEAQAAEGAAGRRHKSRIKELELQLEEMQASQVNHIRQNMERIREVELAASRSGAIEELEQRVAVLQREVASERAALATARGELRAAQAAAQRDAEVALEATASAQQARQKCVELEERIDRLQVRNRELELQLRTNGSDGAVTRQRSSALGRSLVGEVSFRRLGKRGEVFLPGNNDPFVTKLRQAFSVVDSTMGAAAGVHARCITLQLQKVLQPSLAGGSLSSLIREYPQRMEAESERRAMADNVESLVHDLTALQEELEVQHHLKGYDREAIVERLDLEISRCQAELKLLRAPAPLTDVPEATLQMLVDLHTAGPATSWPNGFSPMHWAAQHGRQDIVAHLLAVEGGRTLLGLADSTGSTPLYYAQLGKHAPLHSWLQDEAGARAPAHVVLAAEQLPSFDRIPESYQRVLEQIQTHGWRSMSWRDGYSMLHWASSKGHGDLCSYLVSLDADPNARDGQGRTPIDIASKAGNQELVGQLQELTARRRTLR